MSVDTESDDILRRYLLGDLAPQTCEGVEKRLFSGDQIFWERLCLVEDELIDDYARGAIESDDRDRFESHFLRTDERRAKLELARALEAHAAGGEASQQRAWDWLRRSLASPTWAAAAAVVLLVVALPVLLWRLSLPRSPQATVSVWLSAGLVRDAAGAIERVPIPPGCQVVRLRLEPGPAAHDSYSATVHEVSGGEIWSQGRLRAAPVEGRMAVTLTLPCDLLPEGDYYVRLHAASSGGEPAPLGRYDFRVLRP
jgi:hypothetical protein